MQRPGRREKNHARWCSSNLNLRGGVMRARCLQEHQERLNVATPELSKDDHDCSPRGIGHKFSHIAPASGTRQIRRT